MGFQRRDGEWYAEDVALSAIAAEHGTPSYVYSRAAIEAAWRGFDEAFGGRDHLICYAVKANGNLAVLDLLARLGSGFDIVSGGELERVLAAGGDPARVVFSGVAKSEAEMARALEAGILAFNVESEAELQRLDRVARVHGVQAPVSVRVNPDVDPGTHPYISTGLKENKFGVGIGQARRLYHEAAAMAGIRLTGAGFHIGSQLMDVAPVADALERLLTLVDELAAAGITLSHFDLGGGMGIRYRDEEPPALTDYAAAVLARLEGRPQRILLEPGRAIVGNAGVMLTRVEYLKHNEGHDFAVVDAGMNDLLRPALYGAWQAIEPVRPRQDVPPRRYEVVGPVCESADTLGSGRELGVAEGDVLAVRSAGAYGFVMASNYNGRPRPPELLVDGDQVHVVRERETPTELWRGEHRLPGRR
ncbi:diaminopimelate decarboxylase [Arhodomonas sp. SL1]|uniref:diaminopimelate decarboxylase n=1 Tax=Arhodomonas sp. SL1 TaxID=3425691 RepID=UPI003F881665